MDGKAWLVEDIDDYHGGVVCAWSNKETAEAHAKWLASVIGNCEACGYEHSYIVYSIDYN
jgi:hypothetical protein